MPDLTQAGFHPVKSKGILCNKQSQKEKSGCEWLKNTNGHSQFRGQ